MPDKSLNDLVLPDSGGLQSDDFSRVVGKVLTVFVYGKT